MASLDRDIIAHHPPQGGSPSRRTSPGGRPETTCSFMRITSWLWPAKYEISESIPVHGRFWKW